eukprot:1447162-Amphidinium_carterae.1
MQHHGLSTSRHLQELSGPAKLLHVYNGLRLAHRRSIDPAEHHLAQLWTPRMPRKHNKPRRSQ